MHGVHGITYHAGDVLASQVGVQRPDDQTNPERKKPGNGRTFFTRGGLSSCHLHCMRYSVSESIHNDALAFQPMGVS
jgi:hypothetical protein